MEKTYKKSDIALTAAFTAAVTSFIVGLPLDFLSETLIYPFAHDSALGQKIMQFSGSYLLPIYNEIGTWFGVQPFGQIASNLPVVDL